VTSPLRSKRLRRILVAYTVNRLGTWVGLLALLAAVFDHTKSALAVSALLLAAEALPVFVVPALVARVEASRRRRELSGLYAFEALATVALAVLMSHFWLPAVLLLAALDGTAALAATALLRAEVARAAREESAAIVRSGPETATSEGAHAQRADASALAHEAERRANGALSVASSVSFVLGPAVGGVVVAAAGAPAALFIDAASFLICGALLVDLHPHVEEAEGDSVRARLRAAWRHINQAPALRALLLVETVALLFFEAGAPIEVTFAKATLDAGNRGLGLLLTAWGIGGVLGSVTFARFVHRPLGALLTAGTALVGLGYIGLAAAPTLAVACVAGLIGGVGNGMQWPSFVSVVQRRTPPNLHGRLMGAIESLGSVSVAAGLPLGGALVALSSTRAAFTAIGVGALATTVILLRPAFAPAISARSLPAAAPHDAGPPGEVLGGVELPRTPSPP
jgi:MFS family permease